MKLYTHKLPIKIEEILKTDTMNKTLEKQHKYNTRNKNLLNQPKVNNKTYHMSFLCNSIEHCQTLPDNVRPTLN